MAIEDAYILGNLIAQAFADESVDAGESISAAFRVYDATRRERTQRLVEDSRETGTVYELEHPIFGTDKEKLRETLLTRMEWVWQHDVEKELVEASDLLSNSLVGHQ